jgi:hypothetical protein
LNSGEAAATKKGRANHFARPIASREKGGKPRPAVSIVAQWGPACNENLTVIETNLSAPPGFPAAAPNRRQEVNFAGFPDRFHYSARANLPVDLDRNRWLQVVTF